MRRPVNWLVFACSLVFLFAGLALSACSGSAGGGGDDEAPLPNVSGMLRTVRDSDELEVALKAALKQAVDAGVPQAGDVFTAAGADFSGTYTVENGVDEFDWVRYDGTHLFVAPAWHDGSPRAIRILRTDPLAGTAAEVSSIPIETDQTVEGMYAANGRVFLLTSEANFGPYGGIWPAIFIWAPTELTVHVYDVANPARPVKLLSADIDGVFVASRRVDDRVVLVTRHAPRVLLDPDRRPLIPRMSLDDLLPQITYDGRTRALVNPRRCYVTNDGRPKGYAVITTITTFSLQNPREIESTCYDEPADGVYASQTALYISEPRLGNFASPGTRIHKFSIASAVPQYVGSAEIPGVVWSGGQYDFRMSEYAGTLRVMTTQWRSDPADGQDHDLYVLREKPSDTALEVIGHLPNDARPEEIGKPNEALYAVRFVGERAYAVTFRRIDPLYVLDLANPADPRIAGQLELPGFSEFMHPVSDDLLLGLGSNSGHVKIELFDVSELSQPQSRGVVELGGWHSDSPALYDRHAFTYLAGDTTDRFALPANVATQQPDQQVNVQTSLFQFEVLGKNTPASASLLTAGAVTPPATTVYEQFANFNRAFIHGDTVYYVRDGKVWSTSWAAPSQVRGPF